MKLPLNKRHGDQQWCKVSLQIRYHSSHYSYVCYLNIICIDVLCTRNMWIHIYQLHPSMIN